MARRRLTSSGTRRGADEPDNGVTLCSLHHQLLDRGAYTMTTDREIRVSEHVHGSSGVEAWLLRYHGRAMRDPVSLRYHARAEYVLWHHREVFRKPARRP